MKIQYFQDTDTLYIEFKPVEVAESRDLDENTLLDLDREGNIAGITVEHASRHSEVFLRASRRLTCGELNALIAFGLLWKSTAGVRRLWTDGIRRQSQRD